MKIEFENATIVFHMKHTYGNEERETTSTYRGQSDYLDNNISTFIIDLDKTHNNLEITKIVKNY